MRDDLEEIAAAPLTLAMIVLGVALLAAGILVVAIDAAMAVGAFG